MATYKVRRLAPTGPTAVGVAAFAAIVVMGLAAAYNPEILYNGEKAFFTR